MVETSTPPYRVDEQSGSRPFKIINAEGHIVGSSETRDLANRSIVHRIEGDEKKQQR